MHRLLATLALLLLLLPQAAYADPGGGGSVGNGRPVLFKAEQQAHQHCPADMVVWLNLSTGVYHLQGQRWYGRTKAGAYVCQKEADAAGDRATRNGQ